MVRVVPGEPFLIGAASGDWVFCVMGDRLGLLCHGRSSGTHADTGVERPVLLAVYRGQLL